MKLITLLFACIALSGCGPGDTSSGTETFPVSHTITFKADPVEQRLSFDLWDKHALRTRAKTIYYFYGDKIFKVEVDADTFARYSIGDKFASSEWEETNR